MKKYLIPLIILALLLVCLFSYFYSPLKKQPAPPPPPPKVNVEKVDPTKQLKEKVNHYLSQESFSGAILVAEKNEIIASFAKRYSNIEESKENSEKTQFPIGSITKLFTAAAILKLEELGKIDLKATIDTYLKADNPIWGDNPPDFIHQVAIEDLLDHTSGIEDFTKISAYRKFRLDSHTSDELVQFFSDYPLKFMPESSFDYSGSNYTLLGAIIEEITKKPYSEFLKTEFFDPLNMQSTFIPKNEFLSAVAETHPLLAIGYDKEGSQAEDLNFSGLFADSGAISTTGDLYTFAKAIFWGTALPKKEIAEMEDPHVETKTKGLFAGYGLFIAEKNKQDPIYLSLGELDGYESALSYDPKKEFLVIILTNQVDGKAESIAKKLQALSQE